MRIEEMEFRKLPGELWRCGAMPEGRALLVPPQGMPLYVRADGTGEPFDYITHFAKYVQDVGATDWERVGVVDFENLSSSLSTILGTAAV